MDDKKLKILGVGIIGFLLLFFLLWIGKSQLEDSYKTLPGNVGSKKQENDYSKWKEYTSQNDYFRAYFPHLPEYDTKKVRVSDKKDIDGALDVFISRLQNGTLLMVRVMRYPKNYLVPDIGKALKETMDDLLNANNQNILRNMSQSSFQNHQSINFSIQNPSARIDGTSFFANNSVYSLIYASNPSTFERSVFDHFLSEFVLTTDFKSPPQPL